MKKKKKELKAQLKNRLCLIFYIICSILRLFTLLLGIIPLFTTYYYIFSDVFLNYLPFLFKKTLEKLFNTSKTNIKIKITFKYMSLFLNILQIITFGCFLVACFSLAHLFFYPQAQQTPRRIQQHQQQLLLNQNRIRQRQRHRIRIDPYLLYTAFSVMIPIYCCCLLICLEAFTKMIICVGFAMNLKNLSLFCILMGFHIIYEEKEAHIMQYIKKEVKNITFIATLYTIREISSSLILN